MGGQPDITLGASVPINYLINTKKSTFASKGSGTVTNRSQKAVTFKNSPLNIVVDGFNITVSKSIYSVKTNGKCAVSASGKLSG